MLQRVIGNITQYGMAGSAHLWQEGLRCYAIPQEGLYRPLIPQGALKKGSIFEQMGGSHTQVGDSPYSARRG